MPFHNLFVPKDKVHILKISYLYLQLKWSYDKDWMKLPINTLYGLVLKAKRSLYVRQHNLWVEVSNNRIICAGFNVPLNTLQVFSGTILQVRWPNQQYCSTEGQ